MAKDNRTLGRFILDGIPSAPRGVPQIEVGFDLDANGILNVSAKDLATAKAQHITITASSGLSKEEVDRLVKDAHQHESEDKKRREEIEVRNLADQLVYATEKTIKENREKVSVKLLNEVEAALEECRKAIQKGNSDEIQKASQALTQASHKMAEELYRAGAAKGQEGPPSEGGGKKKDEEVVDAEFTEAKE